MNLILIILRYSISKSETIVVINGIPELVNTTDVDSFIAAKLLESNKIITLLVFLLNVYVEKNDKIDWFYLATVIIIKNISLFTKSFPVTISCFTLN